MATENPQRGATGQGAGSVVGSAATTELALANSAAAHLRSSGRVELMYITAEFEPYSSAQRPDLVFHPESGANAGESFMVELRTGRVGRSLPSLQELREHRNFVETEDHLPLHFALATDRPLSADFRDSLRMHGIETFDRIASGQDLASRVLEWARRP